MIQLEWFRQHKKFVYWFLLPVVTVSMAIFIPGIARETVSTSGPSVSIKDIDGRGTRYMSPIEVLKLRWEMMNYLRQGRGNITTNEAAYHRVAVISAESAGFDAGEEEMKERVVQAVKNQIMSREGGDPKLSDTVYQKLLEEMKISAEQFQRFTHELAVRQRYGQFFDESCLATDAQIFINFVREKEVARLRYQTVKSEDYLAQAAAPSEEKVREFYETNKSKPQEYRSFLFTDPKISADVLFIDTETAMGKEIKPTDEELKRTYEKHKDSYKIGETKVGVEDKHKPFEEVKGELEVKWKEDELRRYYDTYKSITPAWKVETKPGEPAPEAGKEFKPFDTVKADVETKWKEEQKNNRPRMKLTSLRTELLDAEKAHQKAEEAKPEADRKPFDVAAWAKTKGLVHWVTPEQTQAVYKAGKRDVNAPDAAFVQNLFSQIEDHPNNKAMQDFNERRRKEFSYPEIIDKGAVISRIKSYTAETAKPFDESKAAIAEHLKVLEAVQLARKEAEKVRGEWVEGKNLPDYAKLEEVRGDKTAPEPVLKEYYRVPKAVGDALAVVSVPVDDPKPQQQQFGRPQKARANFHEHFHVAVVVDRELPTWQGYESDTAFDRVQEREKLAGALSSSIGSSLYQRMLDMAERIGPRDMQDPDLHTSYSNAQQ